MRKILVVFFTFFSISSLFGAFAPPQGELAVSLSPHFMSGNKYYDADGNTVSGRKFTDIGGLLGFQYGITDTYSVSGNLAYRSLSWGEDATTNPVQPSANNSKLGDANFNQRLQVFNSSTLLLSTDLSLGIPSGDSTRSDKLLTGDGEWNILPRLSAVYLPGFLPGYVQLDFGYNFRTRDFSDEIHAGIQVGLFFWENKFGTFIELRRQHSLKNRNSVANQGSALFANNQSFTSPGLGLFFKVNESSGMVAFYRGALGAENIVAASAFSLTYYYKFNVLKN